jgi:hypothetical protein
VEFKFLQPCEVCDAFNSQQVCAICVYRQKSKSVDTSFIARCGSCHIYCHRSGGFVNNTKHCTFFECRECYHAKCFRT